MYRLVEQEFNDGRVFYVVERDAGESGWVSIYRSPDIEAARNVLNERRNQTVKKVKVIE
jgi:hypothetical protein